jgi:hypothetical protein
LLIAGAQQPAGVSTQHPGAVVVAESPVVNDPAQRIAQAISWPNEKS